MGNAFFQFKQFIVEQDQCAMKVTTDSCLFGGWVANTMGQTDNILDIGAGTGLLSLMLAQKHPLNIDAIEIESECFQQLKENCNRSKWSQYIKLHHGDIRDFKPTNLFSLIICNPPFYENQLKSENKKVNLARHSNALFLEDLFEAVNKILHPNGNFNILLPAIRKEECIDVAARIKLYPSRIASVKQTPAHAFFRTMIQFSRSDYGSLNLEEISIKNNENNYSDQFIELLSEYYLNF
jgi:tRNA1Val (adenine37-N6)-methyltransferase